MMMLMTVRTMMMTSVVLTMMIDVDDDKRRDHVVGTHAPGWSYFARSTGAGWWLKRLRQQGLARIFF